MRTQDTEPHLSIDEENRRAFVGERELDLKPKPFAVLVYLAGRAGEFVTKQEILRDVWTGVAVSDGVVKSYVHEIRRVICAAGGPAELVSTVRGRGYRLDEERLATQHGRSCAGARPLRDASA